MSTFQIEALFRPRSVAVIGASNRPQSVGHVVMRNLLAGHFSGPVLPVNPRYEAVCGLLAYPDVRRLPIAPDIAVLCTPPATLPDLVDELGQRGARAAVVLTAGVRGAKGRHRALADELLEAARRHHMRILGPNCVGILIPSAGLNASFAHVDARPGDLAFVSQSGAVCTAALGWARTSEVGFSCFISLGDSSDIDAGDLLDYLGGDAQTRAILLYLESVQHARKFMSAARAASRNKPVIVVKAGRQAEGAAAAASHTGALAGADDVMDAAIRRAGMLRVQRIDELFAAAETLAWMRPPQDEHLSILTNGGGLGVMAADTLAQEGGRLSELAPETLRQLDAVLPPTWSGGNPVDIVGDAPSERFARSLEILLEARPEAPVLVIHAPTALASGEAAARAVAGVVEQSGRQRVFASWIGREASSPARGILRAAGIPTYDTPDDAIGAFLHLVDFRRNQELLMQTPPSVPAELDVRDIPHARAVIEKALAEGRELLSEAESKSVLGSFGLPCVDTRVAADPEEAARIASELGFPVALKVLSPDVSHKTDVGGVVLDLASAADVLEAAGAMQERVRRHAPAARMRGFTVQPMERRPGAHELILGCKDDPLFGPVILFGQGGTAVEVIADRAVGLPPLNLDLARHLVERTRIARLLAGYRGRPPADLDAICLALVRVSQLVVELPQVVELDVNPLLADARGVVALDARIRVSRSAAADRLAIRPYPRELEETVRLEPEGDILLRPIRPEDEPAHYELLSRLEPDDVRFRFFGLVRELPHSQMARYTQIDYDREMAFIATRDRAAAGTETLGVARAVFDPDNTRAEFAIVVRSDLKGRGLGQALLDKIIRYCRERGTGELVGQVLPANRRMLSLAKSLGFERRLSPDGSVVEVRLPLARTPRSRARAERG